MAEPAEIPEISVDELADRLADGAVVIDVREPDEYAAGHVPSALADPARHRGRPDRRGAHRRHRLLHLRTGRPQPAGPPSSPPRTASTPSTWPGARWRGSTTATTSSPASSRGESSRRATSTTPTPSTTWSTSSPTNRSTPSTPSSTASGPTSRGSPWSRSPGPAASRSSTPSPSTLRPFAKVLEGLGLAVLHAAQQDLDVLDQRHRRRPDAPVRHPDRRRLRRLSPRRR